MQNSIREEKGLCSRQQYTYYLLYLGLLTRLLKGPGEIHKNYDEHVRVRVLTLCSLGSKFEFVRKSKDQTYRNSNIFGIFSHFYRMHCISVKKRVVFLVPAKG